MTRIIAGSAGGRRLRTPTGQNTRPTSDRVREALFSAIHASLGSIAGLRFLDLYAGSGAVGLEALSRGAGVATFVEHDRRTASLIRANADALRFRQAEVLVLPVSRAVNVPPRAPYDLAFLDPPYTVPAAEPVDVLRALCNVGWLSDGALVVVERPSRDEPFTWPPGYLADRSRRYGETTLWYGHATGATPLGPS